MTRPLRVTFILPALTEATSPYWRPIKYSLFPPLGLATLAAYLAPDDEAAIIDEHVEPVEHLEHLERLDTRDCPISWSFRSTSRMPAAPTGSPTRTAREASSLRLGAFT